ncbi:peptide chain release factor N(5)-glutamine methyltransferase [Tenacibaculum sp. 1_MG-2023]|uniref:peptide chain release factor N(5)-glutamine methyltransferase n=1 Tax=Tenacibaculum sp. 1_MG-2023 TaxID=3062653 RepID=UPI0026E1C1DB|nr:peptide chain release factor N(5)-glutamine methyltransferase [Tenacibaculum sp. 1_MG-2023]MDO6676815.1 peptide chain release factor N(5)-glutamine methyltransferase [Tenacibaculum sp. 1_MG-2023]
MLLKQYKSYFSEQLSSIFPQTEINTFFFLLIKEYLGFQRIDLTLQPTFEVLSDKKRLLDEALARLKKEEPIQYILGKTEFYGLPFNVDKNTLIPRPETEELVEWIVKEVEKSQKLLFILDIGTGTGCIPISLKKQLPNMNVSAVDVSEKALIVAKKNAELNDVEVSFMLQDILKTKVLNSKFDIIVSNPPYVRELEKAEMKNNVLENEPHLALFVEDNNPLLFYKKIADLAKNNLTKTGLLFFEINQYLSKETVEMLKDKGFTKIELRKDLFGNNRMIKASL